MEQTNNIAQPAVKEISKNIGYSIAAQAMTILVNIIRAMRGVLEATGIQP